MGQWEIPNMQVTPNGLWRYRIPGLDPNVGYVSGFYAYRDLEEEVIKRYKANAMGVPVNLMELIVDQMCNSLPEDTCRKKGRFINSLARFEHEFSRVVNGTRNLVEFFRNDRKKVTQEEADRRASICAGCVFNKPPSGCPTCNAGILSELVQQIVGASATKKNGALTACQICGCDLKAKVWFPMEVLDKHLTDEQKQQFPPKHGAFPGCWLRKEE